MPIIGGVQCEELREGYDEEITDRGPGASKGFLCAWADRYAVANGLLGLSSGTGSGGPVNLTAPQQWPESRNMFVQNVSITGKGKAIQGPLQIEFAMAVVTAHYGVLQWGATPLPYMSIDPSTPFTYASQNISFSREMVTVPKSSVTLANGHKLKDLPYAFPIVHAIMTIQLHRVPYLPAVQILNAMKKPLNSTTFLGVAPGHLLFAGCDNHMEAASDGTYTQSLSYVFDYRSVLAHDEAFDPDGSSGPQQVRYNGAAILLRSDLSTLIPASYGGNGP